MAKIILFNKPFNVLCQFTDKQGRSTLADFIDQKDCYPAGRLDYDSEGLMVLTDNGQLQHQISHPQRKLEKTYWAQVEGVPDNGSLQLLRQGIDLKDGPCRPAQVKIINEPDLWCRTPAVRFRKNQPTSWLQITISEGRNRQVRRMTAAIGFPTLRLVRVSIGDWSIKDLTPGQHSIITVPSPAHNPVRGPRNHPKARKRTPSRHRRL